MASGASVLPLDTEPPQTTLVFSKSVTPQHVRENFASFDFELSDSGIVAITALDKAEAVGPGRVPNGSMTSRDSRGSQSGARNLGVQRGALAVAAGDAQLAAHCLDAVLEPDESGPAAGFGATHPIVCHQEAQMVVVDRDSHGDL